MVAADTMTAMEIFGDANGAMRGSRYLLTLNRSLSRGTVPIQSGRIERLSNGQEQEMKIRFLFHNPKGERGVGKAITAWTWILACFYNWKALKYNFSHMEIWLPRNGFGGKSGYRGRCFSSTTRGDAEGVRFAPASQVVGRHPDRWSYIEVKVDDKLAESAVESMAREAGAGYDYLGLFGFLLPFNIEDPKKWFCSEICMKQGYAMGVPKKLYKRISPRRAALVLSKFGRIKTLIQ